MKIPTRLKIGGHFITVKQVEEVADLGIGAAGGWTESENLIEIKRGQHQSQKEVTLLHEILHVMNNGKNHDVVELEAQALYQVLKDNKLTFDGKPE